VEIRRPPACHDTDKAGSTKKRVGHVRGAADPLDALVDLGDHLSKRRASEVGEFDGLQARPQPLRVEVRRICGQEFDHQPGPHRGAAMGRQVIPQQRGLLAAEEAPQLAEDFDQAVGAAVARMDVEGELGAAAHAVAERGGHRGAFPVERVGQHRRPAAQRLRPAALPAGMPDAHRLAGDPELAGDLGLADADSEQLGGAAAGSQAAGVLVVPWGGGQWFAWPDPARPHGPAPTSPPPSTQHPRPSGVELTAWTSTGRATRSVPGPRSAGGPVGSAIEQA
jgi:hypothetical protein